MEKMEFGFRGENLEKKEKPPFLYHASSASNILEFQPRQGNVRDPKEGPVVFATPNKALASMFLVEGHNDDWTNIGFFGDIPVMIIRMKKGEFLRRDKGGVLYVLPNNSFEFDPSRGMGEREWTSRVTVKPTNEIPVPSALDAMIESGVYVYFVDQKTFENIMCAEDCGFDILKRLTSENECRNKETVSLRNLLEEK